MHRLWLHRHHRPRVPHAEVDAIDISVDALNVAERNINDHGLEQQVIPDPLRDLFRDLLAGDKYDLIVSNPMWIPRTCRICWRSSARAWAGSGVGLRWPQNSPSILANADFPEG